MATYPTPLHSASYDTGPFYMKFRRLRKDWSEITVISTFEDAGRDFNEHADSVPQRWEITYDGLDERDAKILDEFWEAHRLSQTFTFIEPRDYPWTDTHSEGSTYNNVRFELYEADHSKVNIQSRRVVLVQYPT